MAITRMTDELHPGMTLDQDIYNRNKVLLLARGAVLTEESIKTIKRLGYTKVAIRKPAGAPAYWNRLDGQKLSEYSKTYEKSSEEIVQLIKHIGEGRRVNVEQAYLVTGPVLQKTKSPYNLFPFLSQVEELDDRTHGHSINVSLICGALCQWLDVEAEASREIVVAGLLHDIGKSRISPDILYKPQPTYKELEDLKNHTAYGYRMLEEADAPGAVKIGALLHHEREDGSGYPRGLTGDRIPLAAKIIAVADVYDNMTYSRSRGRKACPFKIFEALQNEYLGILDTGILITFLARTAECYLGEMVRLSDGRTGQIVLANRSHPSRPMVRSENEIIDLSTEPGIEVEYILPAT